VSEEDRRRWNARYTERTPEFAPSPDLLALAPLLQPQPAPDGSPPLALELACGYGGNALWLAAQGYAVHAIDVSDVAIAALQAELAKRRRQNGAALTVTTTVTDLDQIDLPPQSYQLIAAIRFLDRHLIRAAIHALKPGGLLYWDTFTRAGVRFHPRMNLDYCLETGELRRLCTGLEILHYVEENGQGRAVCLGRSPGRTSPPPTRS